MTSTEKPFLLVTGAPAAGKTTLVGELAGTIERGLVIDTDLFGENSHPEWEAWATNVLLVAVAAGRNGLLPILCGYGLHRPSISALPARRLLGQDRCLYLDVPDDTIRSRLAERGGFDEGRITRKLQQAARVRADADDVVDVGAMTPNAVAAHVRVWITDQVARFER